MNLFSQSMLGTAYTCTAHVPIALHVLYVRLLSTIMIGEHDDDVTCMCTSYWYHLWYPESIHVYTTDNNYYCFLSIIVSCQMS